jgi:tRNA1(Val) A37 N6-methylase TrmN6
MTGIIQTARRPEGWSAPGPQPAGFQDRPELLPADDEDICFLVGDWRIIQKQHGHRWSLDDLVTAWFAARQRPPDEVKRHVDLGCGIGSVLQMVAWKLPHVRSIGVEAQEVSAGLARRSLAFNGAEDRVEVRNGDLRDPAMLPEGAVFDLVTGTPPYFVLGTGTVSGKVQAGPCRFETRGGVEGYANSAARLLAPGAAFVVCENSPQAARVHDACRCAGLSVYRQLDVVPREGKDALVSVFAAMREGEAPRFELLPPLTVRDRAGKRTEAFISLRTDTGAHIYARPCINFRLASLALRASRGWSSPGSWRTIRRRSSASSPAIAGWARRSKSASGLSATSAH